MVSKEKLCRYLKNCTLSEAEKWTIVSKIFEINQKLKQVGLFFKYIDFNRIFLFENQIVIDCFEYLHADEQKNLNLIKSVNNAIFGFQRSKICMSLVLPEVFQCKRIVKSSPSWLIGNFMYYLFEVL